MTILRVQMTNGQIATEPFPKEKILGGRATVDFFLSQQGTPSAHPLSEKGIFIVAPGLFAGTGAPQSGRLSVGGKSPLTGGIKEANVGGTASHKLGRLGIRVVVVEGTSKEWQVLKIDKEGARLENAGDIIGLPNYAACDKIRGRYGKNVGILIIGPAGEMKLANSTVAVTDPEGRPSRHAARGGVGALMGAKGLKAIVVDDESGALRKGANEEAFKEAAKNAAEAIQNGPFRNAFHNLGTPMFIDMDHGRGSMPTNNHRLGSFEKVQKINVGKLVELNKARGGSMGHGCMPGCIVRCSPIFHGPDGKFVTAAFEYETIVMLGANLGIDDLDAIARMDRRCDELGLDTIEMGCTIGVLNDAGMFSFWRCREGGSPDRRDCPGHAHGKDSRKWRGRNRESFRNRSGPSGKRAGDPGPRGPFIKGMGRYVRHEPAGGGPHGRCGFGKSALPGGASGPIAKTADPHGRAGCDRTLPVHFSSAQTDRTDDQRALWGELESG